MAATSSLRFGKEQGEEPVATPKTLLVTPLTKLDGEDGQHPVRDGCTEEMALAFS